MSFTPLEIAKQVLEQHSKPLHVDLMAEMALASRLCTQDEFMGLSTRLSTSLSTHIRNKGKEFSKVPNGKGGYKKGIYRLKKRAHRKTKEQIVTEVTQAKPAHTGKGGEFAVMSELLFRDFNCSSMTVDDGIDVVASKNNLYYHIQVKTKTVSGSGSVNFGIKKASFDRYDKQGTFYILVLRRQIHDRNLCDFVILQHSIILSCISKGVITDKDNLSLSISIEDGKFLLNKKEDVSGHVNNFSFIS